LTRRGYTGGPLKNQVNQDCAIIISPFLINSGHGDHIPSSSSSPSSSHNFIMGIFDGYGQLGHHVAQHTATILPKQLANRLEELHQSAPHNASSSTTTTTTTSIQNALIQSFLQVDATLPKPIRESGCTASLLLRLDNIIYVANTGDSQSYIASYHRNTK